MELTKPQIEELFKFTKQHYVEWYDLQCELVDHLADNIEDIWQNEPNITFEKARDISFKKFGIFGFMDVLEKKTKSLNKKYLKLFWQEFKQFFTLPKVILTLFTLFLTNLFLKLTAFNPYVIIVTILLLLIYPIHLSIKEQKRMKRQHKKTGKKYLFELYFLNFRNLYLFLQIPIQLYLSIKEISVERNHLLISVFIVLFFLLLYITTIIIPSKIKEILIKENPEYQIIS